MTKLVFLYKLQNNFSNTRCRTGQPDIFKTPAIRFTINKIDRKNIFFSINGIRYTFLLKYPGNPAKIRSDRRCHDTGAAGISLILDPLLIGADLDPALARLDEIDIGAHRLELLRVEADRPSLRDDIICLHALDKAHIMACTRVKEPSVRRHINSRKRLIPSEFRHILHLQTHSLLRAFGPEDLRGMEAVSGGKIEMSYTHICSEGNDASAAIAAHHPARTIGIEICHAEIIVLAGLQKHQSVSTDAITTVAYVGDPYASLTSVLDETENSAILRNRTVPVVGDQEIISRTLIFIKSHHSTI